MLCSYADLLGDNLQSQGHWAHDVYQDDVTLGVAPGQASQQI